jgi:hypothetical protein
MYDHLADLAPALAAFATDLGPAGWPGHPGDGQRVRPRVGQNGSAASTTATATRCCCSVAASGRQGARALARPGERYWSTATWRRPPTTARCIGEILRKRCGLASTRSWSSERPEHHLGVVRAR